MPFFCIHCRSEIDPKYKACPFCGEPVTDFLRKYLETPIDGKYQLLSRLGVGGMGEVFKALHIHLNAIRVIKLMRANIAGDAGAHDRFLREARLATRINHPNVAQLYDFSTLDETSRYMVWEYIEGTNLHELIDARGPLSPKYAAQIAVQALLGLDAIHRAGIIHRDISPENIMIARSEDGDERVKIIDLGIAKGSGAESEDNKTKTGMFVGKWKYCSPEHLGMLAEGERIDGRADIYSFGIVLYEMLTGVPPFQADTPHAYLMLHASERPQSLHKVNPSITASPELEEVIFRAMEKDRAKRFATAREFAKAIEALIPSLDERAGAPPPLPVAIEVTAEPTRLSPKNVAQEDVATVASPSPIATTVRTTSGARPTEKVLDKAAVPESAVATPVAPKRRGWLPLAIVALVAAIAVPMWMRQRQPQSATASVTPKPAVVVPANPKKADVVPALAPGHLGVNAFPWAEVTSVRNVTTGEAIELPQRILTPSPLDLPPGRYEITFTNPSYKSPVTRVVDVAAGGEQLVEARFADPNAMALPQLDGAPAR